MTDKTPTDTLLLQIARKQRNLLAQNILDAAAKAGLAQEGDKPKLRELIQLARTLGEKAKATTERQDAVDRLAVPGKRFIPDWEAMEAIKRLDKTYYQRWSEEALSGNERNMGYTNGNIPAGDLALIVEYTRSQLIEHGGMKASQTESPSGNYNPEMGKAAFAYLASFGPEHAKVPEGFLFEELWKAMQSKQTPAPAPEVTTASNNLEQLVEWWGHLQDDYQKYASGDPAVPFSSFRQTLAEFMEAAEEANLGDLPTTASTASQTAPTLSPDQRTAIQHAMDVLSSHGDSTTSAGAMVVLDDLLENGTSPAPDFEAVKDKRMGELTPEQQDDAYELWLRNQAGWFKEQDALEFLFKRLDQARTGAPQASAGVSQSTDQANTANPDAQRDQDTLNQWLDDDHEDDMSHAPR